MTARIEREIITGLIIDGDYLRKTLPLIREEYFSLSFARIVAGWCQEYFERYSKAPGRDIQDIFEHQLDSGLDSGQAGLIEHFLSDLSDKYEESEGINWEYLLDKTEKFFRRRALEGLRKDISTAVSRNQIEIAESLVGEFERPSTASLKGIDPFTDLEAIAEAFEKEEHGEILFRLAGDLGKLIGGFERGSLIAILGLMKAGKTWWLQEIALQGLFAGLNVLFVSLEMSQKQMIRRIYHRLTGLPSGRWANRDILVPVFDCLKNQTDECGKRRRTCDERLLTSKNKKPLFDNAPEDYLPCSACRGEKDFQPDSWFRVLQRDELTTERAIKKAKAIIRTKIRGRKFKLLSFPSGTLTIEHLKLELSNLEYYEGFVPDMIVTDYADKFKAKNTKQDYRHQLNEIWEDHKALAQEYHCGVFTASQGNTARTGKKIKQGDWAEDIRKLALIDVAFALNQTPTEKQAGVMRIPVIAHRHEDFDLLQETIVLQSLKIGNPCLDSFHRYGFEFQERNDE